MQRSRPVGSRSFFEGNWQLKASAIVGSVIIVMIMSTYIMIIMETPEIPQDQYSQAILAMAFLLSPIIIGNILNWIGAIKKIKPLLIIGGICYLAVVLGYPLLLVFGCIPAILAFIAAHKLTKSEMPGIPRKLMR